MAMGPGRAFILRRASPACFLYLADRADHGGIVRSARGNLGFLLPTFADLVTGGGVGWSGFRFASAAKLECPRGAVNQWLTGCASRRVTSSFSLSTAAARRPALPRVPVLSVAAWAPSDPLCHASRGAGARRFAGRGHAARARGCAVVRDRYGQSPQERMVGLFDKGHFLSTEQLAFLMDAVDHRLFPPTLCCIEDFFTSKDIPVCVGAVVGIGGGIASRIGLRRMRQWRHQCCRHRSWPFAESSDLPLAPRLSVDDFKRKDCLICR